MQPKSRQRLVDVTVTVVVAVILILRVNTPLDAASPPDWRSYSLMVGMALALLARRRHPTGTLLASFALFQTYYILGLGPIGAIWPIAPALLFAAMHGRTRASIGVATFMLIGSSVWRFWIDPDSPTLATLNDLVADTSLAAAVILAGAMVRNHRLLRSEMEARERAAMAESEAEARQVMSEERLAIAREVHDVVAHGLAGIGVQAHVADELIGSDAEGARTAVRAIIESTSDAMRQLRATVGGLRGAPAAPMAPTLEDLVSATAGVEVRLHVDPSLTSLPVEVDHVARSVVREALTNTVRHSGADRAIVSVERQGKQVAVTISDNGRGGEPVEGHGLRGMRERVLSVGGSLAAGPGPTDGFVVRAELPL